MRCKACSLCAVLVLKSVIPLIIPAASIKHVVVAPDCIIWRGLPPNLHAAAIRISETPLNIMKSTKRPPLMPHNCVNTHTAVMKQHLCCVAAIVKQSKPRRLRRRNAEVISRFGKDATPRFQRDALLVPLKVGTGSLFRQAGQFPAPPTASAASAPASLTPGVNNAA